MSARVTGISSLGKFLHLGKDSWFLTVSAFIACIRVLSYHCQHILKQGTLNRQYHVAPNTDTHSSRLCSGSCDPITTVTNACAPFDWPPSLRIQPELPTWSITIGSDSHRPIWLHSLSVRTYAYLSRRAIFHSGDILRDTRRMCTLTITLWIEHRRSSSSKTRCRMCTFPVE